MTADVRTGRAAGGVGEAVLRPDGTAKVEGAFAYASDLHVEGMLWGATTRSPHAHARITRIDVGAALAVPGVVAVLTHEDVPGVNRVGLEVRDQPVLAEDRVRYEGEPVAVVAADHPETARRAAALVAVGYEPLPPVTDARAAVLGAAEPLHPDGNVTRHVRIRRGDPSLEAAVVVTGEYTTGMQDQAFLGPESGLAVPAGDGGVDLHVATQWLHVDRAQLAPALGLPEELVRITLAGVGGAFGGREDLSVHAHACLLALRTGRPVKMVYGREESFVGHVHRHPARMRYEHGADADGRLLYVRAEIVLDGGAYTSSTPAVVANAATFAVGPYAVPNVAVDCYGAFTNNPPCGAMRGFGAVQVAFAHESQMDRLAAALGLDPVEVRLRNALEQGGSTATGQVLDAPAPVARLLGVVRDLPLPPPAPPDGLAWSRPGGLANTTHGEGVVRGVGYATAMKNICYSEGFDDHTTVRLTLGVRDGAPYAEVHTAAVDVGQGLVTVPGQVVRTELGVADVTVLTADTTVGSAGSTSASRQTYMTAGAVRAACLEVAAEVCTRAAQRYGGDAASYSVGDGAVHAASGAVLDLADVLADGPVERTLEWRHRPTTGLDPDTGQGDPHVQMAYAAHRAVVDVDVELGLVRVVALDCAQDAGHVVHPTGALGQVYGSSVQGLGLALMEQVQVVDGLVRNPSFTDYLVPTVLDVPPMDVLLLEEPDPHAPYGLRGMGELGALTSTPAIVAAVRAATGRALTSVPLRPDDIALPG